MGGPPTISINCRNNGRRREIIDGALIVSPSPTNIHQVIAGLRADRR